MSRASLYARKHMETKAVRPDAFVSRDERADVVMQACVDEYGALIFQPPRFSVSLDPPEALRLARWILETFGEGS
jgi:hypothetical protein